MPSTANSTASSVYLFSWKERKEPTHTSGVLVLRDDVLLLLGRGSSIKTQGRQAAGRLMLHTLRQFLVDMQRAANGDSTGSQQ